MKLKKPSKLSDVRFDLIIRQLFNKKNVTLVSIGMVTVGLLTAGILIRQYALAKDTASNNGPNSSTGDLEYQTVLPDGKSIDNLGGWKRVSPTESEPVYAYNDKISGVPINVSQQPLPPSFLGNTDDRIAELAKKFNATTEIDADGTMVYVGSSAKGPQSAIFTKNSLLILIKSEEKIDDAAWAKYATSLNSSALKY